MRQLASWAVRDIKSGDNTDLWILVAVSLTCSTVAAFGVIGIDQLGAAVLAVLAVMALSQVRTRHGVQAAVNHARQSLLGVLHDDFPDEYYRQRSQLRKSYFFAGRTMSRTLTTSRSSLEDLLRRGGTVRILLPDPNNLELLEHIAARHQHRDGPQALSQALLASLSTLTLIRDLVGGDLQVRIVSYPMSAGFNCLDQDESTGTIMVQHYEFRAPHEPGPIIFVRRSDQPWYDRFVSETNRMWDSGTSWW